MNGHVDTTQSKKEAAVSGDGKKPAAAAAAANYFGETVSERNKRLEQVKRRILAKIEEEKRAGDKGRQTKMISIDQCFKLLRDHEKRIQVNIYITFI